MSDAAQEAEVDEKRDRRDICRWKLLNRDAPLILGGPGVVQIDESLFQHKHKYHQGRAPWNEVWVFGMCDTSQSPAWGVMCIVPNRTQSTLLPILQQHWYSRA